MKYHLFFFILVIINSCVYDPPSEGFTVHNNSDVAVYVYSTGDDSIALRPELQLFSMYYQDGQNVTYSPNYRINAYSYGMVPAFGNRKVFIDSCNNKTVKFYFIREETMRNYSWEEIVNKQIYVKKIELNYTELQELDWIITYDPVT